MTNKQIEAELRLFKAFTVYDEHNSLKNNTVSSVEKGILYTRDVNDNIKELAENLSADIIIFDFEYFVPQNIFFILSIK